MTVDGKVLEWLMADADPSVRARVLVSLMDRDPGSPEVRSAVAEIGRSGWAARILSDQQAEGHWERCRDDPDDLYLPKYTATNWRLIVLAELGLTRHDPRVATAVERLISSWSGERFGAFGDPNGEVCITGNSARMLLRFGYRDHPALASSLQWLVRAQKPDGGWHCFDSTTGTLDAWEALAAFAELPESDRSPEIRESVRRGAEFFLRAGLLHDPDGTSYPPWRRLHYPNHYYYDLLVGLRILTRLGYGRDPRLGPALDLLESKRGTDGAWRLEAVQPDLEPDDDYRPRLPVYGMAVESTGLPSRWITAGALEVLRASGRL